jgi:MinD superfamily P-loop ATPase
MSSKNLTIGIASGKGGVGKSMFASSLAMLLSQDRKIIAVDADVDAPNFHLWLGGVDQWDEVKELSLTEKAEVLKPKFRCQKFNVSCQFGAIKCQADQIIVNPFLCEGCGLCREILGPGVIEMKKVINGQIKTKENVHGFPLISGQLFPGQTGSGKIVDEIIDQSRKFTKEITLVDIPAGIGCPVTAALKETDIVILVTEPTPTGWADLNRILNVVENFDLPWQLVVNKFDLDKSRSNNIIDWAGKNYLGKISYDRQIFAALSQLKPIMETNLKARLEIEKIKDRFYNDVYENN